MRPSPPPPRQASLIDMHTGVLPLLNAIIERAIPLLPAPEGISESFNIRILPTPRRQEREALDYLISIDDRTGTTIHLSLVEVKCTLCERQLP